MRLKGRKAACPSGDTIHRFGGIGEGEGFDKSSVIVERKEIGTEVKGVDL